MELLVERVLHLLRRREDLVVPLLHLVEPPLLHALEVVLVQVLQLMELLVERVLHLLRRREDLALDGLLDLRLDEALHRAPPGAPPLPPGAPPRPPLSFESA